MKKLYRIGNEVFDLATVSRASTGEMSYDQHTFYKLYWVVGTKDYAFSWRDDIKSRDAEFERLIQHLQGQRNMLKDIGTDVKGFISENRQIIYWMALIFLLDHFFFAGAFRERLKGLAERMIGKVEKQIEAK